MSSSLDSRQVRMMRWLLARDGPQSTSQMATDLGLSQRVVRYRLAGVEKYLRSHNLELAKKRGVGIWIEGDESNIDEVREEIAETSGTARRVFARDERFDLLRAKLLAAAPTPISLEELHEDLEVSRTSARRDAKRAEPWLEHQGLYLARKPGQGLSIVGPELSIRRAIIKLVLEVAPSELLRSVMTDSAPSDQVRLSAGMAEYLTELPLRECWELMKRHSPARRMSDEGEVVLPIYLATTAARMRYGKGVRMEAGQLRSLLDHPVAANASEIGTGLSELVGGPVNEEEVAAIAELILGLVSLEDLAEPAAPAELVTKMVELAAGSLHPVLREDAELRRGLSQHLERLVVRLRYGLPVHNPLLGEVSTRYPDVHEVAGRLAELVEDEVGAVLPDDEVGFITMYLSGAMERTHLRPRKQAVIVCPNGMATAWILVSRIQAEFPRLELVDVIAARNLESVADADVIISTVPLEGTSGEGEPPIVVVNPLLLADDIRQIAALVS